MKKFYIRERLGAFFLKEEGKISTKAVLKAGILIGAVALAAKGTKALECWGPGGNHFSLRIDNNLNGDCPGQARLRTDYDVCGQDQSHTNATHDNNLNVRNLFGKLSLGHDNCIETHRNSFDFTHSDSGGGGGGGPCDW